jgi:hypothetical protein
VKYRSNKFWAFFDQIFDEYLRKKRNNSSGYTIRYSVNIHFDLFQNTPNSSYRDEYRRYLVFPLGEGGKGASQMAT